MSTKQLPQLSENGTRIMVALSGRTSHGYAIMKQVQKDTNVRIPIGSLYRTIAKLLKNGLIEECTTPPNVDTEDERRKYYRTTALGERALDAQLSRYRAMLDAANRYQLMGGISC